MYCMRCASQVAKNDGKRDSHVDHSTVGLVNARCGQERIVFLLLGDDWQMARFKQPLVNSKCAARQP